MVKKVIPRGKGSRGKGCSFRVSVVAAHQEICDLQRISPEFAGRLTGTPRRLLLPPEASGAHRDHLWSGGGSWREVEEFCIHQNTIKSQRVGKCVCIKKYPEARAYLANVAFG